LTFYFHSIDSTSLLKERDNIGIKTGSPLREVASNGALFTAYNESPRELRKGSCIQSMEILIFLKTLKED
jgi:hypothetical protein